MAKEKLPWWISDSEKHVMYVTKIKCDNCGKIVRDDSRNVAKEHIYFMFSELGWVAPSGKDKKDAQRFEIKAKIKAPEPGKRKKYMHFCDIECATGMLVKEKFMKFVGKKSDETTKESSSPF